MRKHEWQSHARRLRLEVIIFGSVWFLSKKVTKLIFFFWKKKTETEPKPGQTDRFRFDVFRAKNGSNRFGSVFPVWLGFGLVFSVLARFFPVLARFFRFDSVLLGFFSSFLSVSVSVRFGFFGFLFIKSKPNRTGRFFQKFNRFNWFFFRFDFFGYFFSGFLGLIGFPVFLLTSI